MVENDHESGEDVRVSVELSGSYDSVIDKLSADGSATRVPDSVLGDVHRVIETVARIDGGTRSRIADSLPAEMSVEYDSERVVELLHVLETYELVELEGNTWKPGPKMQK
ncbi:hypothetical protein [Salinirubrum litoreum]|uniref:Uncharacterized protein n=1 Tax=Salinirubrum litoreum TaxID=1126234 RepID=A0ABD5RH49_9EURY|nr:hypothetical protein [Salinirubrum litoreum]